MKRLRLFIVISIYSFMAYSDHVIPFEFLSKGLTKLNKKNTRVESNNKQEDLCAKSSIFKLMKDSL